MCEGGSETAELLLSSVAPLRQRGLELYVITKTHGYSQVQHEDEKRPSCRRDDA